MKRDSNPRPYAPKTYALPNCAIHRLAEVERIELIDHRVKTYCLYHLATPLHFLIWSVKRDSNPRPYAPKTYALPNCAIHRLAEVERIELIDHRVKTYCLYHLATPLHFLIWSVKRDSNPRPYAPKAYALPDCAIHRLAEVERIELIDHRIKTYCLYHLATPLHFLIWSVKRDSNPRPYAPKAYALPSCAIHRLAWVTGLEPAYDRVLETPARPTQLYPYFLVIFWDCSNHELPRNLKQTLWLGYLDSNQGSRNQNPPPYQLGYIPTINY